MVDRPPVTWLIPVRDGARWLGAAVGSALADSRRDDLVVVVDDGSVDDPASALPADPRVSLLRQAPRGIAAALEAGRAVVHTPLIARLDADDRVLPGRLDAQWALLASDPGLAVVGGGARLHRPGGAVPEGMQRYASWVNGLHGRAALSAALLVESPLFHPATLLRADALTAVGGWRQGDLPEDYDLWLRLVEAGYGLDAVERDVIEMADRPDRLTRSDPRYRRAAFRQLKMDFLDRGRLASPGRVGLWGAGRTAKPWLRWLLARGHDVVVVDPFVCGRRRGVEVQQPEALARQPLDLLLVAVGARGARDLIRAELARLRPDLVEGEGWLAVA